MRKRRERQLDKKQFIEGELQPEYQVASKLLILVPGIRTNADWIDKTQSVMQTFSDEVRMKKISSMPISAVDLVFRFRIESIKTSFRSQLNQIYSDNRDCDISLVCHSMGTDIIADILREMDYSFEYIFL